MKRPNLPISNRRMEIPPRSTVTAITVTIIIAFVLLGVLVFKPK